jgi:uncharacterized protein (DUF1501 family)
MEKLSRRDVLKAIGAAGAGLSALPLWTRQAAAVAAPAQDEFFLFIQAAGGWDVMLWADPRNERKGLVEPASTENTDWSPIRLYEPQALDGDAQTFKILEAPNGMRLGPAMGDLFSLASRLTIINGLAMNTVSHPDGSWFSSTGRHSSSGRPAGSSVDTMISNELGAAQLFPTVSINFPSSFIGAGLDRRVLPLKIGGIGTIARSLTRATAFDTQDERSEVIALLAQEAADLADAAHDPVPLLALQSQFGSLATMIDSKRPGGSLADVFSQAKLQASHPEFNYRARFQAGTAVNAAFAVEAMARNLVRAVSFATSGSFDTHTGNNRSHALMQQELFDALAALVWKLDETPHPTLTSDKLSEHVHILVVSEFCRTPQINLSRGRDHYPTNSALILSPRFKSAVVGQTDAEQLLSIDAASLLGEARPLSPADVLATFLAAFGIEPRKYLRDGSVIEGLLR